MGMMTTMEEMMEEMAEEMAEVEEGEVEMMMGMSHMTTGLAM